MARITILDNLEAKIFFLTQPWLAKVLQNVDIQTGFLRTPTPLHLYLKFKQEGKEQHYFQ